MGEDSLFYQIPIIKEIEHCQTVPMWLFYEEESGYDIYYCPSCETILAHKPQKKDTAQLEFAS